MPAKIRSRRFTALLRAGVSLVLAGGLLAGVAVPRAAADFALDRAREKRTTAREHLSTHRGHLRELEHALTSLGHLKERVRRSFEGPPQHLARPERDGIDEIRRHRMAALARRGRHLRRAIEARHRAIARLEHRANELNADIDHLTPLKVCPVRGAISNDFGAPRYQGGYHPHQGNDISVAYGTPIVAPFDGRAAATSSTLGGLGVKVFGRDGYVYNAHLSRLGRLGWVRAGTVIGYVGTSGDATGPHDHFEWHPWNGPAVDPHVYLLRVC